MIPPSTCHAIGKKAQAQLPSTGSPDSLPVVGVQQIKSSHQIDRQVIDKNKQKSSQPSGFLLRGGKVMTSPLLGTH